MSIWVSCVLTARGIDGGNSGNVLYCPDNQIPTFCPKGGGEHYIFLDLCEGKQLLGLDPDLGEKSLSVSDKIEAVLNRLERLDPNRARSYRKKAKDFFNPEGFSSQFWFTIFLYVIVLDFKYFYFFKSRSIN